MSRSLRRPRLAPFPAPIHVARPLLPDLDRLTARLRSVWESGWLTNDAEQVRELERRLRALLAVPHLVAVNNGTTALLMACRALELGGEVITTPFTFPATVHALDWAGLQPVFADVDPQSLCLDPRALPALLTPRTSAVLAVHVYGHPCDVVAIDRFAREHGLRVVYDAAHAFGVTLDEVGIGTFGDLTAFSFHATKLFHTAEGGALTGRGSELADRLRLLRNFGIAGEEEVVLSGINGKLSELHAALGLLVLDDLAEERRARAAVAAVYRQGLGAVPGIALPPTPPGVEGTLQHFAIRVDAARYGCGRDALHAALRSYNVHTRKYFYPLCSDIPTYRLLPSALPHRLPVAHAAAREVLCLPLHGGVSVAQAGDICELIRTRVAGEADDDR